MRSKILILILANFILPSVLLARVRVVVLKADQIYSKPSSDAKRARGVGGQENFKAYWQSPDRKWIYISNGTYRGWVLKTNVKVLAAGQ